MQKTLFIFLILLLPQITSAEVYISEIMYDLEGTDSNREWVEIHNDTDSSIELSTYYFYENNVAHKITGEEVLGVGEYGIIADSIEKFNTDWSNFDGKVFDSSFNLSNSGEDLFLLDSTKNEIDFISYSPDHGAKGTGNSLQYYDGYLIPGEPTPSFENVTEPVDESVVDDAEVNDTSGSTNNSSHSSQNDISDYKPNIKVKTGLGRDRIVALNTPIEFEVYTSDADEKGRYFWNFGDGKSEKGKKVEHYYKHEGVYNLILNSVFSNNNTTSRIKVYVNGLDLEVLEYLDKVEIKNKGEEINLGEFILQIDNKEIEILKDTIISKGHSLFIDTEKDYKKLVLRYPNGEMYYSNSLNRAEKFCSNANSLGLSCNVNKMKDFFDRI
jgi:hypothetical protein